jgi:hypothetical protein
MIKSQVSPGCISLVINSSLMYNHDGAAVTLIAIPFAMHPSNLNNQDPLFVASSTGDYLLAKGSACIDSGTSTDAPATDIKGNSRPRGQGFDMGACEYKGTASPNIKSNGQPGSMAVSSGTPVSITVGLDPDNAAKFPWWGIDSVVVNVVE